MRSLVDDNLPCRLEIVSDPVLPTCQSILLRHNQRSNLFVLIEYRGKHSRSETVDYECWYPRRRRLFGRAEFRCDSARAEEATGLGADFDFRTLDLRDKRNQMSLNMGSGVLIINAVDIAQHDEKIGSEKRGDQRREMIIVAEFHLFDRHRVVLIDDGNDRFFH